MEHFVYSDISVFAKEQEVVAGFHSSAALESEEEAHRRRRWLLREEGPSDTGARSPAQPTLVRDKAAAGLAHSTMHDAGVLLGGGPGEGNTGRDRPVRKHILEGSLPLVLSC